MELKELNFTNFVQIHKELYEQLRNHHSMLSPWFSWANYDVTRNKIVFYNFIILYLAIKKYRQNLHKGNPTILYKETFLVYNSQNHLSGMCGLYDIDTIKYKTAEVWGFTFRGNYETENTMKLLENHCANTLNLERIYGCVMATNIACRRFWKRYGYDEKICDLHDGYIYIKNLTHEPYTPCSQEFLKTIQVRSRY